MHMDLRGSRGTCTMNAPCVASEPHKADIVGGATDQLVVRASSPISDALEMATASPLAAMSWRRFFAELLLTR